MEPDSESLDAIQHAGGRQRRDALWADVQNCQQATGAPWITPKNHALDYVFIDVQKYISSCFMSLLHMNVSHAMRVCTTWYVVHTVLMCNVSFLLGRVIISNDTKYIFWSYNPKITAFLLSGFLTSWPSSKY